MSDRPEDLPAANSPQQAGNSRWTSLIIFGTSLALSVGAWLYLQQIGRLERQAEFSQQATMLTEQIRVQLEGHAQALRGLRAFLATHGDPSDNDWRTYFSQFDIETNLPGILAYGFAPLVSTREIDSHISKVRASGLADYKVHPRPQAGFALPLRHISPDNAGNRVAYGFNLYAETEHTETVDSARDRNALALSRRTSLVQDKDRSGDTPGFLMILPIYRDGADIGDIAGRRSALTGVVYAAYRMQDFMNAIDSTSRGRIGLRIYDASPDPAAGNKAPAHLLFVNGEEAAAEVGAEVRQMDFGGRSWHLHFSPASTARIEAVPAIALVGGILVSLLLGLLSRAQASSRVRAEHLAKEMTRDLRLSEERFQLAAAGAEDGLWDRDLEKGTVWHSARLKRILGFPEEANTGDPAMFMARVHPEDRERLIGALDKHFRERQPYVAEYRFRKADDSEIWLSSRGQAVWDQDGYPVRMVGAITDITERKTAEARLAYYRSYLATVLKFVPHPVFVKDRLLHYVTVSSAFCELLGKPESELVGQTEMGDRLLPENVVRLAREMDERVLAGDGTQTAEYVLPLANGERSVLVRKTLAKDPDGAPLIVGTLTDLTALRAAERDRAAADLERQTILDAATEVCIIATDTAGTIRLFNRGAEKMLGYQSSEMVGKQTPTIIHLRSEVAERERFLSLEFGIPVAGFAVFITMARMYGSECREWTYVRKDGSRFPASLVVTTVRDEAGGIVGYLGIATDISEREAAAAELRRHRDHLQELVEERTADLRLAKDAAELANEAKSEFLANISHELRTPLHSILSFASLGSDRAKKDAAGKLLHYFERIQQSGARLLALVNDLLELSKLEAGKMRINPAADDVLVLIREAATEMEGLFTERQLHVEITVANVDTVLPVDGERFSQVIRNILSNAIKYSPSCGTVRVSFADASLQRGRRSTDGARIPALAIEIRDEGPGIPEAELDSIFDKFVQSSRTSNGAGGTGLGLAISREIVHAHRGTIRAYNNPDGGAAFTVTLPREIPSPNQG